MSKVRSIYVVIASFIGFWGLCFSAAVMAHDSRPVLIELTESESLITVSIKAPSSLDANNFPMVTMPDACRQFSASPTKVLVQASINTSIWQCAHSLSGETIGIVFPNDNPSLSTLIKWQPYQASVSSALLAPSQTHWQIPTPNTVSSTLLRYSLMGVEHILVGVDHLLFVALLLLLAGSFRRSIITITGFTLGHSVTLIAATLGYVSVPVSLFEAMIGLSIVFLVIEIIRQDPASWTLKYPMIVAVFFGLIHGLGFASVLTEIGLPPDQLFWGLAAFNLGIEIGQIVFVAMLVVLSRIAQQYMSLSQQSLVTRCVLLGIGYLSAFWFWERAFGQLILEFI